MFVVKKSRASRREEVQSSDSVTFLDNVSPLSSLDLPKRGKTRHDWCWDAKLEVAEDSFPKQGDRGRYDLFLKERLKEYYFDKFEDTDVARSGNRKKGTEN
jgi:hypothetical protein